MPTVLGALPLLFPRLGETWKQRQCVLRQDALSSVVVVSSCVRRTVVLAVHRDQESLAVGTTASSWSASQTD